MENVIENKFYSRRLTNDMRNILVSNITKHINEEFVKNPLYLESLELINVFTAKFWENVYKVMPKEDVDTILKYPKLCSKNQANISQASEYETRNGFKKWTSKNWDGVSFGPNLNDYYVIPGHLYISQLSNATLDDLGDEFCEKFYNTLNLNECEKEKIINAMKVIVKSATTTGKLVEAYPEMMKFIPEDWKKQEHTSKPTVSSVKNVDVDINAFLK